MLQPSVKIDIKNESPRTPPTLENKNPITENGGQPVIDTGGYSVLENGGHPLLQSSGSNGDFSNARNTSRPASENGRTGYVYNETNLLEFETSILKEIPVTQNDEITRNTLDERTTEDQMKHTYHISDTEVEKENDSNNRQDSLTSKNSSNQDSLSTSINEEKVKSSSSSLLAKRKDKVVVNVGGQRHVTYRSTLRNVPDTRLSWLADGSAVHSADYDKETGEFFFDRHPVVFSHILNYYRTGKLHVPYDVCGPLYEEELSYWGIDDSQVESCCWISYRQHRDAQDTLKDFEGIEFDYDPDNDSEPDLARYGFQVDFDEREQLTRYERWLKCRPKIWSLFEDPSSKPAKILAYVSMALILLSVMLFCIETMESFRLDEKRKTVLLVLEGICVAWFTFELAIRFIVCPSRIKFIKNIMNWIDFLAIIPFFVEIILVYAFKETSDIMYLQIIRVIRVFRIIKLSKHNVGLQILGHTLKASIRELFLLIFFLAIGIVIFASIVYYCEKDQKGTKFQSIPNTFWWAVITMTTVGYGDMAPTTPAGKIVGSFCAICGVLMIALPVPVIVNNFNLYYSHAQARLKLPKKKRKVLVNAANALKDIADVELQQTQITDDLEHTDNDEEEGKENNHQCTVMISEDAMGEDDAGDDHANRRLRLQKFGRRDSSLFGAAAATNASNNNDTGRLSIGNGNAQNYALQKRRSLLPGMSALPEID